MTSKWSLGSWRRPAMWFLVAVLAVAATMLVLDGGRPAVAAGECQYQPYGDPCAKATPTLTNAPQPAGTQVGSYGYDRATLSGGNAPTGTITFKLYAPGDETCTNAVFAAEGPAFGNTDYYSGSYQVDRVGTWHWTVAYSGDDQNEAVSTGCHDAPVTVTKATPSIFLWPYGTTSIGSTLYASGYGYGGYQPTGGVTVRLYRPGDPTCSGEPAFGQEFPWSGSWVNIWTAYGPADEIGTWRYKLDYPGDANNNAVSIPCGSASAEVVKASPSGWANVSPGALTIGGEVSFAGYLSGYKLTGAVAVRFYAPNDPGCSSTVASHDAAVDSNGSFATTFTPTSVGTWRLTASYPGDAFNNPVSWGPCSFTFEVSKASPGVLPAANPTTAATGTKLQAFTLVQGGYQPGGRVSFRLYRPDDPTCEGLPAYIEEASVVGGAASTSTGFVVPSEGTWRWQAVYLGDANNNGTTSGCDRAPVSVVAKLGIPPRDPGGTPFVTNVYFNCRGDHSIGVPYGSRLVLRIGFATKTERQIKAFLSGVATSAVVDGTPVGNADQYWGKPFLDSGSGLWTSRWEYDTGRVVTAYTQPFTIEFQEIATKSGTDGFTTWNAGDILISTGGPCLVDGFQP